MISGTCFGPFIKPNPNDCFKYFNCEDGLLKEYTCGKGTLFDKFDLICYPDTMTECAGAIPTTTPSTDATTKVKRKYNIFDRATNSTTPV